MTPSGCGKAPKWLPFLVRGVENGRAGWMVGVSIRVSIVTTVIQQDGCKEEA